jgi:hypothetical protein
MVVLASIMQHVSSISWNLEGEGTINLFISTQPEKVGCIRGFFFFFLSKLVFQNCNFFCIEQKEKKNFDA